MHVAKHQCYRTMYDYVHVATPRKPAAELDAAVWYSPQHPARDELPPVPAEHLRGLWGARAGRGGGGERREAETFTVLDLNDLLHEHPFLKTEDDVLRYVSTGGGKHNRALRKFVLARKDLGELIARVFRVDGAEAAAARRQMTRVQILAAAATEGACTCETPGRWAAAADEVLRLNGFTEREIQRAIFHALHLGRAKQRNLLLVGETNRAKSFLIDPVELVYNCFTPPDTGSHQLADIAGSEVLFLNDFEWDAALMPWSTAKNLFEGKDVKIAVPKVEKGAKNYMFTDDAPILGTAPGPVEHPKKAKETSQMDSRVRYVLLTHFFDPTTCPEIKPCKKCWAQWVWAVRDEPPPPAAPLPREWYGRDRGARRAGGPADPPGRENEEWVVRKRRGEYRYEDLPGRCFKCGRPGHLSYECDVL